MEAICRLCAKEKSSKQLVRSIEDRTSNIQQKLIDCCRWNSVSATDSETLPKKICNSCYRKLDISWSFAESVADAQQQIFSMFAKEKSVSGKSSDHVDIMDTDAKQKSHKETKSQAAKSSKNFKEPLKQTTKTRLASKRENIDPNDDGEVVPLPNKPISKRKPKPLQEKRQTENDKVKSKSNKQPKKNIVAKSKLPRSKGSVCDTCGKVFIGADLLKRHMKIHSDERPHKCRTCGKRFLAKNKLKDHENIHTGIKPYACHLCDYRCANHSNSLKHMRQKHGVARKTEYLWGAGRGGMRVNKQVTYYKVDK